MPYLGIFADIPTIAFILFAAGILLLVVEMLTPGFGVAGISALIAFVIAIFFASDTLVEGLIFTGIVLAVVAVMTVIFFYLLSKGKLAGRLVLKTENSNNQGFSSGAELNVLVGTLGKAQTALRPAGRINVNGTVYDALSSGDYITAGEKIEIIEVHGSRIVVAAAPVLQK